MKKVNVLAILAGLLFVFGCSKEVEDNLAPAFDKYDPQPYIEQAEALLNEDSEEIEFRNNATVLVAAGSGEDAVQNAINAVGPGGTVILGAGIHAVDGTVTIEHKVKLTGQPGAVLEIDTELDAPWPITCDPAIHVLNTNQVVIENLTIRDASGSGSTAVLLENTNNVRIRHNTMADFQLGVVPYLSDNLRVHDNSFIGNPDDIPAVTFGILFLSGHNPRIYDNSIVDFNGQIFVGSTGGVMKSNYFSGGFLGILFCTPQIGNSIVKPDGETVGTDRPASGWLALENMAENTVWGYLAIDGANNNTMVNNNANNNLLDIEMAGVSDRFGVVQPTSFENLVISSVYPDVTIKVCGVDNEAVGGTLINTSLFPCD